MTAFTTNTPGMACNSSGSYTYTFTAPAGTSTGFQFQNTGSATQTFYLDDIVIREVSCYLPEVVSYADYSPFGTVLDNRHADDQNYRYGFNGMERDDELKTGGNSYDYGARFYDPRVGRWLSVDPEGYRTPGLTPYRFGFNNPVRYSDPNGKFETDGHYWTVYLVARMLGIEESKAVLLAASAELPDHVIVNGVAHATSTWAIPELQQTLHALTGGNAQFENITTIFNLMHTDVTAEGGIVDFGILLHRLGDSYAHRNMDIPNEMYGDDGYTTDHAFATRKDGSEVGSRPDVIINRLKDHGYENYIKDLTAVLSLKFGDGQALLDMSVFNKMTNYALGNELTSLLGIIQYEASKFSNRGNSFFVEYEHGHDVVTNAAGLKEDMYPKYKHRDFVKNAIDYMVEVDGIDRAKIHTEKVWRKTEFVNWLGRKKTKTEYIGRRITYEQ